MSTDYRIAETETFEATIADPAFNRFHAKLKKYVYPQIKQRPHYGPNIKKLKGKEWEVVYRYRLGDYRLLYLIDETKKLVIVLDFAHRKHIYQ